jgi:hypothetical protein
MSDDSGEKVHHLKTFTALLCARIGTMGGELSEASEPRAKFLGVDLVDCAQSLEKLGRALAGIKDAVQKEQQSPPPSRPRFLN